MKLLPVLRRLEPTHRVLLGVFVNYAVVQTTSAAAALAIVALGWMPKANALVWTTMLSFLTYFGVLLWCFAARDLWRIWLCAIASIAISIVVVAYLGGDVSFGFGGSRRVLH
ncbi:MAG: DUF3649 domain-containing protein [Pseudomonadota bacterium]